MNKILNQQIFEQLFPVFDKNIHKKNLFAHILSQNGVGFSYKHIVFIDKSQSSNLKRTARMHTIEFVTISICKTMICIKNM